MRLARAGSIVASAPDSAPPSEESTIFTGFSTLVRIPPSPLLTRLNPTRAGETLVNYEENVPSSLAHSIRSSRQDATESDAIRPPTATKSAPCNCIVPDPDPAAVVDGWPAVPEAIRTGILARIWTSLNGDPR
jgi:hypothetical protein